MQIYRLLEIINILFEKNTVTATELARHFEVSERTIYRDIDKLSLAKIPVVMKKGYNGGISLLESYTIDKAMLSLEEKKEVLSAVLAIGTTTNSGDKVYKKLSNLLGETVEWIEVDFSGWLTSSDEKTKFNALKQAVLDKKIIQCSYASYAGKTLQERTLLPLRVCFKNHSWYLYAYCTLRQETRLFKLSRIKNLVVTDESHNMFVKGKVLKDIDFKEDMIQLTLKIDQSMAFRVYDEFSCYKIDENGDFIAELSFPKGEWLLPYIASFGSLCEVLKPEDIRNELRQKFEKIAAKYK